MIQSFRKKKVIRGIAMPSDVYRKALVIAMKDGRTFASWVRKIIITEIERAK